MMLAGNTRALIEELSVQKRSFRQCGRSQCITKTQLKETERSKKSQTHADTQFYNIPSNCELDHRYPVYLSKMWLPKCLQLSTEPRCIYNCCIAEKVCNVCVLSCNLWLAFLFFRSSNFESHTYYYKLCHFCALDEYVPSKRLRGGVGGGGKGK